MVAGIFQSASRPRRGLWMRFEVLQRASITELKNVSGWCQIRQVSQVSGKFNGDKQASSQQEVCQSSPRRENSQNSQSSQVGQGDQIHRVPSWLPNWDEFHRISPVSAAPTRPTGRLWALWALTCLTWASTWAPKFSTPPSASAAKVNRVQHSQHSLHSLHSSHSSHFATKAQARTASLRASLLSTHILCSSLTFSRTFATSAKMSNEITHETIKGECSDDRVHQFAGPSILPRQPPKLHCPSILHPRNEVTATHCLELRIIARIQYNPD